MRLEFAARVACWAHDRSPGGDVAAMAPAAIAAGRRPYGGHPLARWAAGPMQRGVRVTDRLVPTDAVELPIRVYTPARPATGPRPVVLRFHGGGWVVGNPCSADWFCSGVALAADAVVISAGYRLAPEHRAPTAALDAFALLQALTGPSAEPGTDPTRVAVAGESAGGNLAAVVALLARDAGGPALAGQALLYPAVDGTLSSPSIDRLHDAPGLNRSDVRAFLAHYLGPHGDPRDPRVSPLLAADHRGLPPALIQTAEHDPLLDDGSRYTRVLREAGVPVRYTRYLGAPHGFYSMPRLTRIAAQARDEVAAFLAEVLAPPT